MTRTCANGHVVDDDTALRCPIWGCGVWVDGRPPTPEARPTDEARPQPLPDLATSRWDRNYAMIDALRETGAKYRRALDGERLATFSIMGTSDWEDYASLSFNAMQLEVLTDMDRRVDKLEETLGRVEGHLARIAALLAADDDRRNPRR